MRLTEDNCQIAYCCGSLEVDNHGRENLKLEVKLQGAERVVSIEHSCSATTKDKQQRNGLLLVNQLVEILELFMSQSKPVLLVFNAPSSSFLPIQRAIIHESDTIQSFYGVIAAFANALPVFMTRIPSKTRVEQFELPVLAKEVLGQEYSQSWEYSKYSVRVLEKIATVLADKSELIAISESYAEVILSGLNIQMLRKLEDSFRRSVSINVANNLKKIERPRLLPYLRLKNVFDRLGATGIANLLIDSGRKGNLRMNADDLIAVKKLRWTEIRKQQYEEEKPFTARPDEDIDVGKEFPINQDPVDQDAVVPVPVTEYLINLVSDEDIDVEEEFPVDQISVNEYPINLVSDEDEDIDVGEEFPVDQIPVNEYPINLVSDEDEDIDVGEEFPVDQQFPVDQDAVPRVPVNQIPIGQDAVVRADRIPVNEYKMSWVPVDQNAVFRVPVIQYPMSWVPVDQDAIGRVSANQVPVNEHPMNYVRFDPNPDYQGFVDRR